MADEKKTITLPLEEALDYLYERGLTIDKLWVVNEGDKPETHITTKRIKGIANEVKSARQS